MPTSPHAAQHREVYRKVEAALRVAEQSGATLVNKFDVSHLHELGVDEPQAAILTCLKEINEKAFDYYRPPSAPSTEPETGGQRLFAFVWDSKSLNCEVYLKFVLKMSKTSSNATLYIVSFHKSTKGKK
jgi:hypothetical protein